MKQQTLELLEEQLVSECAVLNSDILEQSERSKAIQDIVKLAEQITNAESVRDKAIDDQERRRIDEKRNNSTSEIEKLKLKFDWKRMLIEGGKIAIPALINLVTLHVWKSKFDMMLKFEESGSFKTAASKEVKLPRILK